MTDTQATKKRTSRKAANNPVQPPAAARAPSKQECLAALLVRDEGATLDQMAAATGWLPHTTRAAMTGLRKKGVRHRRRQGRWCADLSGSSAQMISVDEQVAALPKLGRAALQQRWRELFKSSPPAAFTPDLIARGIAHRVQEKAMGRLDPALARQLKSGGEGRGSARPKLRPGNRLVRRWRGRTYVVDVVDDGFRYDEQTYGSLSEIATLITGTRWSGPRFFGLPE